MEQSLEHNYRIAICQNGKYAVTLNTVTLDVRILKNNDYHRFKKKKDKPEEYDVIDDFDNQQNSNTSEKMTTIAEFTIGDVYRTETDNTNKFGWSLGISNIQKCRHKNNVEYFILVAVSRIDVNEEMNGHDDKNSDKCDKCNQYQEKLKEFKTSQSRLNNDFTVNVQQLEKGTLKKGTAIYRFKLNEELIDVNVNVRQAYSVSMTCYYSDKVSGICRFIENLDKESKAVNLRRFIILNFHGIYNFAFDDYGDFNSFNLNERFEYPKSFRNELDNEILTNSMNKLLTCLYDQYFLIERYKNNIQVLEVYDLTDMRLRTIAKRVEQGDKYIRNYHKNSFAISYQKSHLCFTRGIHSVKLYLMESGLEIGSKKFRNMDKIYSLEFIDDDEKLLVIGTGKKNQKMMLIWDIYYTDDVEEITIDDPLPIKDLDNYLARTSGNLLQVDYKGNVTSVLSKVKKSEKVLYSDIKLVSKPLDNDEKHIIHFDNKSINPNFETIVDRKEPWIMKDYERNSYCLYNDSKETLQLIVGISTVQIWHQIHSDPNDKDKKKKELPNKGEPFLEYIWANGVPVNQENELTRLQVEEFKYGTNNGLNNDFYLKVFWYERESNEYNNEDNGKKIEKEKEVILSDVEIEKKIKEIEDKRKLKKTEKSEVIEKISNMERKWKVIKRKDITKKVKAIRHACKALEHLNKRVKNKNLVNYVTLHRYEEIVAYINHIVCRFVRHEPDRYKLLDARHKVMKNLILGDCDYLIKFILFGDEDDGNRKEKLINHTPRSKFWKKIKSKPFVKDDDLKFFDKSNDLDKIKPTNDLELAIYHCKGREIKDTIMVAYLLEYYSQHAMKNPGWMTTVSKALPLLFKYNYDDYVQKLFRKECFANQDHFSSQDPDQIIPAEYLERRNHDIDFRAFKPKIVNLESDKFRLHSWISTKFKRLKNKLITYRENFDSHLGKSPLALRVVPLPGFTKDGENKSKFQSHGNVYLEIIKNIGKVLWCIFIPRSYKYKSRWWYKGDDDETKLSSFSRMILYENNGNIYDNPAIEAVINFRWKKARDFFFFLFLRFLIFASCFMLVSWGYLVHDVISEGYRKFLVASIIVFYYLAVYLLSTEMLQLFYRGPRKYFKNIFNYFDIASIVLPVIAMSLILKSFNGSGRVDRVDPNDAALIAFAIFIIWIQLISYLRLIPKIAIYLYHVIYIVQSVFPLMLFTLLIIIAFAHAMFILLRDPKNIDTLDSTFSGVATNPKTNDSFDIKLQSSYNITDWNDNPFSYFPTAVEAAYFWLGGNWVQKDHFDFWAVNVFTLIASIFLVVILQNMLIAFMSGVYEQAATKSRQTLLRYQAIKIADYEALWHFHFWRPDPEPRYICYLGQSKHFEEWYNNVKNDEEDQSTIYKGFNEKSTYTNYTYEEADYNSVSIWKYDGLEAINKKIEEAEKKKKDFEAYIEELHKELNNVQEGDRSEKNRLLKKIADLKAYKFVYASQSPSAPKNYSATELECLVVGFP